MSSLKNTFKDKILNLDNENKQLNGLLSDYKSKVEMLEKEKRITSPIAKSSTNRIIEDYEHKMS